ncbi:serine hydrolase FSH [Xylaria cf. heliscus]|nr:serine hydrolase FSH [Xylaria cf. heliscus]
MRFLCLHGRGTTAKIFEMQTARIRQALGRDHQFVFANGNVPTQPDAGAAAISDEYFGYVGETITEYEDLYHDLLDIIHNQGPFDGLMGFSEGGAVAAWMLIENSKYPLTFGRLKCAIFFSAAVPFDPDVVRTGVVKPVDPIVEGEMIEIPTAHVWSKEKDVNVEAAQSLASLCDSKLRETFLHSLGHNVPGSKSDSEALAGTLRIIERTIERAREQVS